MTKQSYDIQWRNKDDVGGYVDQLVHGRLQDNLEFYKDKFMNILWSLTGRQDIFYDRYSKAIIDERPPEWKVKVISNFLFPQVRTTIAKLAKQPIWDMLPATTEQDDISIANLGKNLLTHYWFYLKMPSKYIDFITWLATTGNALLLLGWDSKAGETLELNPEQRAVLAAASGKKNIPKKIQLGDPFIKVGSPFSCVWEEGVKLSEAEWFAEVTFCSPEYIYKRYKIKASPRQHSTDYYDTKLFDIHNGGFQTCNNKVVRIVFYTKEHQAILINGKCEIVGENPYGEIMAVHCREVPVPGNEFGESAIGQNRPNQALYNGIKSRILQHIISMGNPKWAIPRGAKLNRKSLTSEAGEIIEYNYPYKPDIIAPRALPAFIERMMDGAKQDMKDTGSYHDVSAAQGEPGLRSGKAVLALQDADDLIQSVPLQLIDDALKETGSKLLRVLHKFVTEDRLVRITGESRELQVQTFTGQSLQGKNLGVPGANYFDVRVASFSAYPLTRIGMEDRVEKLINLGLLDPINNRRQVLSMLSNSDLGPELDRYQVDRTRQNEENYQMLQGQQVQAFNIEDHDTHIETLDSFLKPKLAKLNASKEGQQIIMAFMKHRDEHEIHKAKNEARKNMLQVQAQLPVMLAGGANPQALVGAM